MKQNKDFNLDDFLVFYNSYIKEVSKVIVGNTDIVKGILICILSKGHVLLEGIPGIGKTKLVQTIADVMNLKFSRIQFTPDLMPSDIIGTTILEDNKTAEKKFKFNYGPIFSNIVLADEINRATPKTQSSLLEAMQENSVSFASQTHSLDQPFIVLATQNPIEMEGTYSLPEAQMDRFLFKLIMHSPNEEELKEIIKITTEKTDNSLQKIIDKEKLLIYRNMVLDVLVSDEIMNFAIKLIVSTHPENKNAPDLVKEYVRIGSSPRGLQSLILSAKSNALINGRVHVSKEDILEIFKPSLRHRVLLNFAAEAENISSEMILDKVIT
jgi:MoxR-like ATPase